MPKVQHEGDKLPVMLSLLDWLHVSPSPV